jgi:arabinogalactan oligomer/maltooligosaccharide transport system permease protein
MMLAILAIYAAVYGLSVRSALKRYDEYEITGKLAKTRNPFSELLNKSFPVFGLAPAVVMIVFFVIVPLVFSVLVAFTNYSVPDHIPPNNTVDWVGFRNFVAMFGGQKTWTGALGRVALWTLVWGALATGTCYLGGTLLAVVLHESKIKLIPFFRTIFILPYAVPAVVSMLVWQNLLNGSFGIVNQTLIALHIIKSGVVIPWLSDEWLAKFTCVLVNFWAGVPYFMLLVTGTLTAIPKDIFEASSIDGANKFQVFTKITLPLVLYQTMPLIIMSFTFNINNFGAIFFLTGGRPIVADSTTTSAAGTDILVTWIYKLTITLMDYKYASVLAVMIFVVLAPFAIFNFRRTKSFKEGRV